MARVPYAPETNPGAQHSLNLFRMLAHSKPVFDGVARLGTAILTETELDPRLRELAIVPVRHLMRASYELTKHVAIARAVGVSEAELDALVPGASPHALSPVQRAVLAFTDEVALEGRASDPTFARVAEMLDARAVVELVTTVGYYGLICRLLETLGIDHESA